MAMPNASNTAKSWDDEKDEVMLEIWNDMEDVATDSATGIGEFLSLTLPALAQHFDGEALDKIKRANPWLAVFATSSTPGWEQAKTAYFDNGPAFLDALASFTKLLHYESLTCTLLSRDIIFCTRLLLSIRREMEGPKSIDRGASAAIGERATRRSSILYGKFTDLNLGKGVTRARIEALLRKNMEAEEDSQSYINNTAHALGYVSFRCIFRLMRKGQFQNNINQRPMSLYKDDHASQLYKAKVKASLYQYITTEGTALNDKKQAYVFLEYAKRVKTFVWQVGCAKVHQEPDENIAELRLFHSTTIGYFAKLQDQYLKKALEVKKLRHAVTALEFRSLLEHLPELTLHQDGGPRLIKFWEKALTDEVEGHLKGETRVPAHALQDLVNKRNPKRAFIDPSTGAVQIHKKGKNGFLYATGEHLYSTLSDEVHRYRVDDYDIGEVDGWTQVVTDVLRALKPLDENIDAETHEVDWAKERLRYI